MSKTYAKINRNKLDSKYQEVYDEFVQETDNFKNEDALLVYEDELEEFYKKVESTFPDALKEETIEKPEKKKVINWRTEVKDLQKKRGLSYEDALELYQKRKDAIEARKEGFEKMIEKLVESGLYSTSELSTAGIDPRTYKPTSKDKRDRDLKKDSKQDAVTDAEEIATTGRRFKRRSPSFGKAGGAKLPFYYEYRMNRRDKDEKVMLALGGALPLHAIAMYAEEEFLEKRGYEIDGEYVFEHNNEIIEVVQGSKGKSIGLTYFIDGNSDVLDIISKDLLEKISEAFDDGEKVHLYTNAKVSKETPKNITVHKITKFAKGGEVPNASGMFHLPLELVVYVPSTQDVDKVVTVDEMNKRIEEVKTYLAELFGGYTSSEKLGGYMATSKKLVNEQIVQVVSFATKEAYEENKNDLVKKISEWAKEWGQEAIGLEFEGDLYYVPQQFAEGGDIKGYKPSNSDKTESSYKRRKPIVKKMVRTHMNSEVFSFGSGGMAMDIPMREWLELNPDTSSVESLRVYDTLHDDYGNINDLSNVDSETKTVDIQVHSRKKIKSSINDLIVLNKVMYAKGGVVDSWWTTKVNPNESNSEYDNLEPINWDVDMFSNYCLDQSNSKGELVNKDLIKLIGLPKSKLTTDYLKENGSGFNNDIEFKKYGTAKSAYYDIFKELKSDYIAKSSKSKTDFISDRESGIKHFSFEELKEIEKSANFYTEEGRWSPKPTVSKFSKDIEEYTSILDDLVNKRITPSKVIGKGHKTQYARGIAFKWLHKQIAVAKKAIEILNSKTPQKSDEPKDEKLHKEIVSTIASKTGVRESAISSFAASNNLSTNELSKIAIGLGTKKLSPSDVSTAVSGNTDNKYAKKVISFAKSNKALEPTVLNTPKGVVKKLMSVHLLLLRKMGSQDREVIASKELQREYASLMLVEAIKAGAKPNSLTESDFNTLNYARYSLLLQFLLFNGFFNEKTTIEYQLEFKKSSVKGSDGLVTPSSITPPKVHSKYIVKNEITSIEVLNDDYQILRYDSSSILNGVNLFERGGSILEKKADYYTVAEILIVRDKHGNAVKHKNGYWILKNAKPINIAPTDSAVRSFYSKYKSSVSPSNLETWKDKLLKDKYLLKGLLTGSKSPDLVEKGYSKMEAIEWICTSIQALTKVIKETPESKKTYQLGDKYSSDFDYDGMLEYGEKITSKTSVKDLELYRVSLEDVNYHPLARLIGELIEAKEEKKGVLQKLNAFKKALKDELSEDVEEFRYGGALTDGDEITFIALDGEPRKGTIVSRIDKDFEVSTSKGVSLVGREDILSKSEPKQRSKFLGFFEKGGEVGENDKNKYFSIHNIQALVDKAAQSIVLANIDNTPEKIKLAREYYPEDSYYFEYHNYKKDMRVMFEKGGNLFDLSKFQSATDKAKKEIEFLIKQGYDIENYSTDERDVVFGEDTNHIIATQGYKRSKNTKIEFAIAYLWEDENSGELVIDKKLIDWLEDGFLNHKLTVYTNAGVDLRSNTKGKYKNIIFKKIPLTYAKGGSVGSKNNGIRNYEGVLIGMLGTPVRYKDELYEITSKGTEVGITRSGQGAWASSQIYIPAWKIEKGELTKNNEEVWIPTYTQYYESEWFKDQLK